ncbi:arylamine N-acetyltransferase [Amycolatopsis sp. NPDC058986]|uniref:arylamine N-acetyltransferase family protein n=1 Tax=unclassified Amycolatopsis TaxID=2618356 RepID=UPI00366B6FFD
MDIDAYLARIGVTRPVGTDASALRRLQEHHLAAVPFENLSIHLGEPIELTEEALFDKIVGRRRGGFCYELNGLFAALLRELGFAAALHGAYVFHDDGTTGPALDHAAIRVDLAEPWLVDVGFGRFSRAPLRLDVTEPRADLEGEFLIREGPAGDTDVSCDGKPQYRLEQRPRALADFAGMAWYQATSPDSHFVRKPVCSLPTPNGRISLSGDQLIETVGDTRRESTLDTDGAILATYRERFGISLTSVPRSPREQP